MKPASVDYAAPTSSAEAVSLLSDPDREAVVLAGGQSLMPMLNTRLARPELLVDLGRIDGLDYIRGNDGRIEIGAMTTKRSVERSSLVSSRQPLLHAATLMVGHPQIRNRGTIGGSMAHADPAAEYPAVAVASDARMRVLGPQGERTIQAEDFFVTYLTTALEPAEILIEVSFPMVAEGTGWAFTELSRRHGDFAMAGTAITLSVDAAGSCADVRIVLFGVQPAATRMRGAEAVVDGGRADEELFARAGSAVADEISDPLADVHATADYRRHLADVLTQRGLAEAVARATASP
ncbi:MAG: xanthine dehydrogenase family protein subunit M [Acidimicrobiia bacterium]